MGTSPPQALMLDQVGETDDASHSFISLLTKPFTTAHVEVKASLGTHNDFTMT